MLRRRDPLKRAMNAMSVVVIPELVQLPHEINRVPEERAIEILPPDRADQPFDERMGNRGVRHRLDLFDLEHAGWQATGGIGTADRDPC